MPINIVPKFLQKAFASSGAKADIPVDADLLNGRAGYNEGFPPVNMTPVAAGGIPPYGQDMNGVLYDLSAAIQYLQSGVNFPFDATFATAVGGYAAGAIVSDASDKTLLWVNGTANNTAFPSGWTSFKYSDPTETVRGLPLVATQTEVDGRADDQKVVTAKKLAFGLSISTAVNGYIKLPNWLGGFMIQWVRVTTPSTSNTSSAFTWPLAFAGGEPAIGMAPNFTSGSNGFLGLSVTNRTPTGASLTCVHTTSTVGAISATTIIGVGF